MHRALKFLIQTAFCTSVIKNIASKGMRKVSNHKNFYHAICTNDAAPKEKYGLIIAAKFN